MEWKNFRVERVGRARGGHILAGARKRKQSPDSLKLVSIPYMCKQEPFHTHTYTQYIYIYVYVMHMYIYNFGLCMDVQVCAHVKTGALGIQERPLAPLWLELREL